MAKAQDHKSKAVVSAFEENLGRFALVSKDNRINVWDTAAGTIRVQCFAAAAKGINSQYTSITWGKSNVKTAKGERGGVNDVAVGTHSGIIYIWDLLTAEIVLTLGEKGEGHVGAVNDLVFHHQGGAAGFTLYSCGADGYVIQWDLRNSKPALKWQANTAGVSRIAAHSGKGHSLIATADTSIKVWDLASQKTLIKFTAEKVTNLQFTPDGDYLVAAGNDRVINMWSCKQQDISANKKKTFRAFSCDSIPLSLRINKKKGFKSNYQFLAVSEGGLINIFDTNTTSKGITPAAAVAKIQDIPETNGAATSTFGQYFLDANFYDTKELLVIVGPETAPSFQRISYANDDGSLTHVISVSPLKPAATTEFKTTIKRTKDKATTLEASSIPPQNVNENKKRKKSEPTIGSVDSKKLAEIEKGSRDSVDAGDKNVTFQAALEQAIHTNDQQLLNKCFTISNYDVIKSTLLKLAPSFIIPLVKLMISILQTSVHHQSLYSYLHIIVMHHTSLLMSSGALREMSVLHSAIHARSLAYLDLLKAKGRVDLLLAHLDQAQSAVVVDTNAKNVYKDTQENEEEGSEEDAEMEDDDEEDGEDGSGESDEDDEEGDEDEDDEGEDFIELNGKGSDESEEDESEDENPRGKRKKVVSSDEDDE